MKQYPFPTVYYSRSRFRTQLPADRRYVASHFWLLEEEPGIWRAGFTKFAIRMMGDLVDCAFTVEPQAPVALGQPIGTVEGLKALSELYSVVEGRFIGGNPDIDREPAVVDHDPYRKGWLYRVEGRPDENNLDVHGYVAVLDATIEKMLGSRYEGMDKT